MARLDLDRFVGATAGPDGWDEREAMASAGAVDLGAYAVARLEFEA
jgi:hypothetical protein